MDERRRRRRGELFDAALDLPTSERSGFLARACADDTGLREDVAALLAHDADAEDGFLGAPPFLPPPVAGAGDPPGTPSRIGGFEILRVVGEGGMGLVFEARQEHPRRTVALKVVHPGLASENLLKRLHREASILGRLQHPGIAQIHEAGTARLPGSPRLPEQPYFAMEFVRGRPLTDFVRQRRLGVDDVLRLLAEVCDAVQHAHEQGVVHRDLKPANILVTEEGRPKILDFGVASLTGEDRNASTLLTTPGQILGTLAYMSPEQVHGDPDRVDARSDVYSLGVLLFELLGGRLPYDLRGRALPEAARLVREEDPPTLGALDAQLRGDVETIVAKALDKQPERRYPSAASLAADIRRHLHDEAIVARPASRLYKVRKFTRRHKALVGGVGATLASLLAGLIGMTLLARSEAAQHRLADANEQRALQSLAVARRNAYRQAIHAAEAALDRDDAVAARIELDQAEPALRGWEWEHFVSRLDDSLMVVRTGLRGPGASHDAFSVGLSDDGRELRCFSSSQSGFGPRWALEAYDVSGDAPALRERLGVPSRGPGLLGSRDHRLFFAVGSGDARFVDPRSARSGVVANSARDDLGFVMAVHHDEDGTLLLEQRPGGIALFDAVAGTRVSLPDSRIPLPLFRAAFSADGSLVAYSVGQIDRTRILVWDVAGPRLLRTLTGLGGTVAQVAFDPAGRSLAAASHDGRVRQWDLDTGLPTGWVGEPRHVGRAHALAYSPDGRVLASGGQDRTVRTWDARTGMPEGIHMGHEDVVLGLAFSADGRRLASGDAAGVARVWDLTTPAMTRVLRGHDLFVYGVATSPDGALVWSASWDGTLRAWDADSGEPVAVFPFAPDRDVVPRAMAVRPDGRQIALLEQPIEGPGSLTSRARLIDLPAGSSRIVYRAEGPERSLGKLAWSRDGALLVASGMDGGEAVVLETGAFAEVGRVTGTGRSALSQGGPALLATTSPEHHVLLYDLPGLTLRHELVGHETLVWDLAFSQDGALLFSAGDDWTVRAWDCATGELLATLEGHTGAVYSVALSPDGTRLASGSADHSVRLWDTATFEEVCHLHGHDEYVFQLAWAPGGRRLFTGSGDATVRVWELDPLRVRHEARTERRRLVAELSPRVDRLLAELPSADAVAARLREDATLTDREREVALQVLLGRALGEAPAGH